MTNIERLCIKEFKYWLVMLHKNQCHLGRCVLWCKRKNADDFIEITKEEKDEFFEISKKLNNILRKLWQPDRMNYTSLGNRTNHLHIHFVPRYKENRIFENFTFTDIRWGKNYAPYDRNFSISDELKDKIKYAIQKEFEKETHSLNLSNHSS